MGIVREISPELDPVEFPDNMDEAAVDAFMAQRGRELRQGLIARRQAQLAAETEGDEALAYREGKVSPWEYWGSVARELPQEGMRQAGQLLRGTGQYLASSPMPRERGEMGVVDLNRRLAQRTPQEIDRDVEGSMLRQLGTEIVADAPERFPTLPGVRESLPSQVSAGLGSVAALLPAGLTGPAAPFVGGAMYGLSAGEDFADDAEQVINSRIAKALAQGNTELAADLERRKFDMKNMARAAGRGIGGLTQAAFGVGSNIRLGKSQIGGIGKRIAERLVPKGAPEFVQNRVRGAAEGFVTEAAQEMSEQALGNAAAKAVYDPNRKLTEGVVQSGVVGGLTGNVVGGAFGSKRDPNNPLPASRAAISGEVVPGTEIPQDIGAPDLTLEDLGDLLPVEAGPEAVGQPGTPVPATQETPENMGISQGTPVPEALVEPAPETPAVDSPTLNPATAAETPTAPETPASPAPSSSVEGVTGGEQEIRNQDAKLFSQWQSTVEAAMDPMADSLHEANARTVPESTRDRFTAHGLRGFHEDTLASIIANGLTRGSEGPVISEPLGGRNTKSGAPLILISKPDKTIQSAGIGAVVVNRPWADQLIPALQAKYPGVLFISPGQLPAYLNQTIPVAAKPKRTRKVKRVAGGEAAVAPTPAILPDDTAMEAATAAAMAPRTPALVTTAPDEGIAERAAVDDEMTRATTRVPEVAPAQVGMPDEGIAATAAADAAMEQATRRVGETPAAAAMNRAPEEGIVGSTTPKIGEEAKKQEKRDRLSQLARAYTNRKEKSIADALKASGEDGTVELFGKRGDKLIVSPEPSSTAGEWRVTQIDDRGPVTHHTFKTRTAAVRAAAGDSFSEFVSGPEYHAAGDYKVSRVRKTKGKKAAPIAPAAEPAAAQAAEVATPEVVKQSKPPMAPKAQKAFLLEEIDKALEEAPDPESRWEELADKWNASPEKAAAGPDTKAQAAAQKAFMDAQPPAPVFDPFIIIEVPGNGTFKINNTKRALKAFKERAKKFPTDTAGPTRTPLPAKGQSKPAAIGKNTKETFLATAKDFVSDDPDRNVLHYVMSDGRRSAATDGRVMLVWDEPVGGKNGEQKLFGLDGKEVKADQSLNIPNWNSVIPKSPEVVFKKLNTERLFGIVKQAIAGPKEIDVGKRRTEEVLRNVHILSNPDGSIGVFSESQFGDYVHNVQKGAKNISKVDGERLLDIVQAARRLGSESVSMSIDAQDAKTPLVFKWDGAQAILMPLGNVEPGSTLQSLTAGEKQPDILERALNAGEVRMAQPTETDPSSKPLSDELISTFTETDEYDFVELKPDLLLEQISSGKLKLKPVRAALLSHLLRPDTRHKLRQIELVKSKEFSGRFNTRGNSNVGSIQISTIYKDGTPVSVNHFAHALTHELVHNAVTSKLDESPEFKQRAKSLYDYVKEKTPGTKWADSYAMSNLSEFFAEGMANSGFRKFLLGIEYPVTMRTPGMPSTGRLSAFGGMLYLLKQALNLPKFIYDKFTGQQVEAITALDELIDVAQRLESRQRVGSQAMMGFMEAFNPPAIERALNAAIKATDRTSATFSDPFLIAAVGLPVLNAALRIVRRVYLKTRDLARAKRQGMRLIRRQLRTDPKADLPRIEEAFNQLVEGTAEKPGPDQIEAFQAADGSRRQKSRGLFTGDVTVDTDAEWQAGAERWINQFNGNIRRAFEAARSTDYATTGLNPAAQDYVFGRLLELTEIQANAARNDVDALRAINLQKEIADAMRLASSEAGKALGARALVQNRLLWMFPVLNYRNLIREAQKRLPFPDVVADEVRTWLQESGRRAVQEMRNAMTDADKVFARELKTTVRDMRVVWRDVMTASVESQEAMRRKILEELVKAPELKGLSRQGYIDIANLLGKAWERERARIFAAEFRKQVPLPSVKEDVRRKLFTAIPDVLKWANLGLLDNEAFRNAVAPKFGVAKFNGETAKKLNTMAQQAQRVGGVNRNRIIAEMYDTMQREGGVRWPDIVRDYWYAAVLGAVNTQVDNALGVINGALNTVMGMAMSPPEVRKAMGKAYKEGFGEAIADFFPILWRGDVARAINFNPEQPANTLNALSKSGNLFARGLSVGKYVSRLMTALDQVNALSTDQAMKAYALGRRLPVEHVRRYMMPSENVLRTARLKAESEGTPPNLMRKRVREIVQESIPVEVLISSKDIRELVTFTNQPKGLMGALYRGVQEMEKKAPGFKVLSGTNFLRFAANYSNEILNYVAPVALYRYYVSAPSRADGRLGLKMGQEERQLILAKLAVGTALGTFAAALFLGDDDDEKDRKIDITGSFKSLDPNKRKQLLSEGRAPYSIRIGDKYVSYRQLPFGGVLGAIGELRDRQLHNPKEWNQESIARKFVDGAFAGSLIVRDSPAISSFTEFLGTANAYKYDMNEQVEKSLPKYIARLGGSFIPRIAKEIDAWADPAIYKANTGHEFFLQQMPIFRRELGEGPVLNVLGEPVQVERYPWSRWIKTRKEDKAWSTLGELASKGVFLPVPSVTVKVLENGKRREMTPAESYRYQQRVGQAYRKFVEDNAERLLRMKPDEATDFIDTQTERIRSRIRAGGA